MFLFRIPGTKWCGKDARTDSFFGLGGYSTADRYIDKQIDRKTIRSGMDAKNR